MKEAKLGFNVENGRYGLLVFDLWEIEGLHCGQALQWYSFEKEEWVKDRLECDYPGNGPHCWYFFISKKKGIDLEGLRVRLQA